MATNPMKVVRVAYIVAFVFAGFVFIGALWGPIVLLPAPLVPLAAGIGILRKRVWSAFGFAVYLSCAAPSRRVHSVSEQISRRRCPDPAVAILIPLFFFAGRSLSRMGGPRGLAWPWFTVSAMTTVPFLFVQAYFMPTGSMEDTLLIGDRILVQHFPEPEVSARRLDCLRLSNRPEPDIVKRVIGIPGDHIKIVEKTVSINGAALREPYVIHKSPYPDSYRDNLPSEPNSQFANNAKEMLKKNVVNGEVVVPPGKYFVLGR